MESKYLVRLVCSRGYTITERPEETLKEAKSTARYLMSDTYANVCESSHEDLCTDHVEVIDRNGDIVWDDQYKVGC